MGRKEEIKKEDLVQAVVFADNFNTSFQPLTSSEPSCLLPLAGRPLIEYTLQSLSRSGVQDVVLYLTSNSIKVKDWLKGSEWSESYHAAPFSVTCITNEECRSFGDGMRDLYEKGVLRNDFILVSGDLISNLNLAPYLNAHKENLAKDKHSIMSSIYIKGDQGHPLRGQGKELVLATDRSTQQLVFYQRSSRKSSDCLHFRSIQQLFYQRSSRKSSDCLYFRSTQQLLFYQRSSRKSSNFLYFIDQPSS
ncbi:translation initiation factor eIF-2B subunit epsilon [Eurytemora carolleeae]|uniref:translation initiation factor eIF-2B subunit epsilon n=1 Tax=Eurytemora carolleeae TaxID=1294199 RepID=UPI000C782431|nr:translation initiation factor eIF-2B subunit epsilon [Eurytemora carolleeae]|eukprot:XP_023342340.1 translation initiation factor eIF-2B subunit epsilon-like [Eurytemora affinis]